MTKHSIEMDAQSTNFLLYSGAEGGVKVDVMLQDETLWLTQQGLAELFETTKQNVSLHIKSIYQEEELETEATVKKYLTVRTEGIREVKRELEYYNLDMIIAVGYRVNSKQATQFRIWATQALKEYIIKGFILDDDRLKQGKQVFGKDYFDELLERIREIRASERRFYQKITDIYASCSIDYDKDAEVSHGFYASVQNKLHWAIHHHTAAELISERVDATKPNMGLQTWKNAPTGEIRKGDTTVAKNYLYEKELSQLNRIVTMYLDFAENQAERQMAMTMQQWAEKLDGFLVFNGYDVLEKAGKIKAEIAKTLAHKEYEKFRKENDIKRVSDFDQLVEKTKKGKA